MFKFLVLALLGYIAYRMYYAPKAKLPPQEKKDPSKLKRDDYTDYEEIN